jgi:hypothetical protein
VLQSKYPEWETVPSYTAIAHSCKIHSYLLFLNIAVVPQLECEGKVFDVKIVYHLTSLPSDR